MPNLCKTLDLILSTTQRKKYEFMCLCMFHVCVCTFVCGGKVDGRNPFLIALQPNSLRQDLSVRSGFTHTAGLATILLWRIPSLSSTAGITVRLVFCLILACLLRPRIYFFKSSGFVFQCLVTQIRSLIILEPRKEDHSSRFAWD